MLKRLFILLLLACMVVVPWSSVSAAKKPKYLKMTFYVRNGTGPDPMFVLYAVDMKKKKKFVKTVRMFSKDKEYFKDLTNWWTARDTRESKKKLDAVVSPTIRWNSKGTVKIPVVKGNVDLLKGRYRIYIESRKEKGGHYKSFKIDLKKSFKGGVFEHKGYVKKIKVELID